MKDNYEQLRYGTKVANSELYIPISDYQASQLIGGQDPIVLIEVGKIDSESTAIQIVNETNFELSYGFNYGKFEDVTLKAGETKNHSGNTGLAAVGWDEDLNLPHIQLKMELLKPGYKYALAEI